MQWVFIIILLLMISYFSVFNALYEGSIYVFQTSTTNMYVIFQLLCCIPPQDHTVIGMPSGWGIREVDDMEMSA